MALKKSEQTLHDLGELAWLRRVRGWFADKDKCKSAPGSGGIELGIGDDAAVLRAPGPAVRSRGKIIATSDTLIENVHFRLHTITPRELGYKALVVNLSDLAAMASTPVAALLNVSVPAATPVKMLGEFFMGVREAARKFSCPIAGGDMTSAEAWHITVTALGAPVGKRVALRSAARAGDYIYVTGWPGESGAALHALENGLPAPPALLARHRKPAPRLAEAAALSKISPRLAMLDVSDGVYNDAGQLARASGVRIDLNAPQLPLSPRLKKFAAETGHFAAEFFLFGGEDYELLLASPLAPEKLLGLYTKFAAVEKSGKHSSPLAPLHCIGRAVQGSGVRVLDALGKPLAVRDRTFKHY